MRIFLRGRKARVAEEFLNAAHIGARTKQMRGKGVPQNVGGHLFLQAADLDVFIEHPLDRTRGKPSAPSVHEKCVFLGTLGAKRRSN